MWQMFFDSFRLLLKGKLFREPRAVFKQWLIGFVAALVAVVGMAAAGVPLWLTVVVAAFGTGVLQPYLFKDLKFN